MDRITVIDNILMVNGRLHGTLAEHIPTRDTVRHAESVRPDLGKFVRLTGRVWAFGAPHGILYYEVS